MLDGVIRFLTKLDKKNSERPIVGDLFCDPIPGYKPTSSVTEIPDIKWRSSIRDLVELLMVLNELGVFSDRENNPITFTRLVKIASSILGVEIKQPFKIRNDILARTGDKEFFTERMESALRSIARKNNP